MIIIIIIIIIILIINIIIKINQSYYGLELFLGLTDNIHKWFEWGF